MGRYHHSVLELTPPRWPKSTTIVYHMTWKQMYLQAQLFTAISWLPYIPSEHRPQVNPKKDLTYIPHVTPTNTLLTSNQYHLQMKTQNQKNYVVQSYREPTRIRKWINTRKLEELTSQGVGPRCFNEKCLGPSFLLKKLPQCS